MVSSNPDDAGEIVRRLSNGEGLLSNNGASICNLMTGDATRAYLTTAAIKDESQGIGDSKAFLGLLLQPERLPALVHPVPGRVDQGASTRRAGPVDPGSSPQMHRGLKYAGMRAASNVLLRDVNTSLIIEEMYRGANVIYADFTDYDELAHHCGPERVESFEALDGVDAGDRDAGQGRRGRPPAVQVHRPVGSRPEPRRDVQAALRPEPRRGRPRPDERAGDARPDEDARPRARRSSTRSCPRSPGARASARPSPGRPWRAGRPTASSTSTRRRSRRRPTQSTIAVVGSGNLGLVYFTGHDHRLTAEELEELHPNLRRDAGRPPRRGDAHDPHAATRARSCSDRRASATSTRTGSTARIRRRSSARTRS